MTRSACEINTLAAVPGLSLREANRRWVSAVFMALLLTASVVHAPCGSADEPELPLWAQRMDEQTAGAREKRLSDDDIAVTIHVEAKARGRGDGSSRRPFGSLQDGLRAAQASLAEGRATKLKIGPGTYREPFGTLDTSVGKARETLFILEGEGQDQTIVTGADVVKPDAWEAVGDGVFSMAWDLDLGHHSPSFGPPEYLAHRSEMLFIDGQPLRQVLIEPWEVTREGQLRMGSKTNMVYKKNPVLDPREVLEPGTFGVAELDDSGRWSNRLFIKPESPSQLRDGVVEVSRRPNLLRVEGGKDNLVIRGIAFTKTCSARQGGPIGPVFLRGRDRLTDVLIEDCAFVWNNFTGLRLRLIDHLTIRNSRFDYNGDGGINMGMNRYTRFENNSTSFNNWRGHYGNYYGWSMGGIKFHETEFNILRDHVAIGNLAPGIWYDIQCEHVYIDNLLSSYNTRSLFLEIGNGPHLVDRSIIAHGTLGAFKTMITGPTTVRDTVIYNNSDGEQPDGETKSSTVVEITHQAREHSWHKTQRLIRPGLNLYQNNVVAGGPNQEVLVLIAPGRDVDEHSQAFRYIGEGNLHWSTARRSGQPTYAHRVTTPGKPWTVTQGVLRDYRRWTDQTDVKIADPGFTDPNRLDFTVGSRSPVADHDRLPLRRVDPALVQETRAFFAWGDWQVFLDELGEPTDSSAASLSR